MIIQGLFLLSHQGSNPNTNGVVSAFSRRETIDFTSFSGTFQDTAMQIK